jgi:hypothetical protein
MEPGVTIACVVKTSMVLVSLIHVLRQAAPHAGTPTCLARVGVFGHFWPIRTEQVLELPAGLQQEGEAIR